MDQSLSTAPTGVHHPAGATYEFGMPSAELDRLTSAVSDAVARSIKRTLDVVAASLALICLFPVLLIVAALVRLDSRGAIVFCQKRRGQHGRIFWCLKFRTMVADAEARMKELAHLNEAEGGVLFKIKDDPRITCIGRFLRRSSLDELPQLFNILMGHMSLVGPRPLQLRDSELLEQLDPAGYRLRLSRPQGLTGLWQVSGRSDTTSLDMLKLDLDYVSRWSLALDLKIIVKTFRTVITGRGAC